jgi:hypothetical protein
MAMNAKDTLIAHLTESLAIERRRVDALMGTTAKQALEVIDLPEPDVPPDEVMAAMKQISPIKDKTYEANYAYWEANKERARLHPEAFAEEIISGGV